jgi:hypothetical protein
MNSKKQRPVKKTGHETFIATYFMAGDKTERKTPFWWEKEFKQRIISIYNDDLILNEIMSWIEYEHSSLRDGYNTALAKTFARVFSKIILKKIADKLSLKKYIADFKVQRDRKDNLKISITPISDPRPRCIEEGMIHRIKVEIWYEYEIAVIPKKSRCQKK